MAGGDPVIFEPTVAGRPFGSGLDYLHGLIWTGRFTTSPQPLPEELELCSLCRKKRIPLLAVDEALLVLNTIYNGSLYQELSKERPEALQHRHPPEKGLRHAIWVNRGCRLAGIYGEGELVVNSEHRGAVNRVAKGFRVSAQALDGVIEAIEADHDDWFALGVQWRPAAATASGLDIQLFRGLVDAARDHLPAAPKRTRVACASAA
jgi:putative glutamine amidotransferase